MTSSTSSGSMPERRTASATARVPSSKASTSSSEPLNAVPMAVLAVETITRIVAVASELVTVVAVGHGHLQ